MGLFPLDVHLIKTATHAVKSVCAILHGVMRTTEHKKIALNKHQLCVSFNRMSTIPLSLLCSFTFCFFYIRNLQLNVHL